MILSLHAKDYDSLKALRFIEKPPLVSKVLRIFVFSIEPLDESANVSLAIGGATSDQTFLPCLL